MNEASLSKTTIRPLALYLPQYHPIPENDKWWGKGFTEWTNVSKARPMFNKHYQPHFPADLGYYDLRVPEVREAQANMAKAHGIEGFLYYHYWFGNGRQLLERPFNEVLQSGKPDFPFCLCWANETWRGAWFGEFENQTLIEQTYPGKDDYVKHFYHLLPAFNDARYIKVEGKPWFNVYMPLNLPDMHLFSEVFNQLAIKEGFPGMFLVGSRCPLDWNPYEYGFDAVIGSELSTIRYRDYNKIKKQSFKEKLLRKKLSKMFGSMEKKIKPVIIDQPEINDLLITDKEFGFDYYPCVLPNWDNTPRAMEKGLVFTNSSPELFYAQLEKAVRKVNHLPEERRFVIIKSWNEWAEGNYLEPDTKFGFRFLEQVKKITSL